MRDALLNTHIVPRVQGNETNGVQTKPDHGKGKPDPETYKAPPEATPPNSTETPTANQKQDRFPKLVEWKPVVELVGVLVVITYTSIAACQVSKTSEANEIARQSLAAYRSSFKQEQRAYLWASSFNASDGGPVIRDPNGLLRPCADVHVSNSGRTPAIGVHLIRQATYGDKTRPYMESDGKARDVVMGFKVPAYKRPTGDMLGVTGDKWATATTDVVDDITLKEIVNGDRSIYVYGVVQYFDIFGDYHETGFCSFKLPGSYKNPFSTCPFGNWMDKRTPQ